MQIHSERITQKDKSDLDCDAIKIPMQGKDFNKVEKKNNICINVFCYKNKLTFPVYISDQKSENSMDFILLIDKNKSHYVYIKGFDRFMFHKTRINTKNTFAKVFLQCFSSKNVLKEHKRICLSTHSF